MSTRYTLTIRNKKDPERLFDSYQLFGNDDYIKEIHDFVAKLSSEKDLKIEMNEDSIYALQSAYLFQILFRHKGTRYLEGKCEIKPDFTVEFEYH